MAIKVELGSVDQKLSSLQSLLAQRPFLEVLSGLGTFEPHECRDLKPAALLIHAHPWGIHMPHVRKRAVWLLRSFTENKVSLHGDKFLFI